jgi:hypothetical protein
MLGTSLAMLVFVLNEQGISVNRYDFEVNFLDPWNWGPKKVAATIYSHYAQASDVLVIIVSGHQCLVEPLHRTF